jgi:hypothetical protein
MGAEMSGTESESRDLDPGDETRRLLRTTDRAALATRLPDGAPFASLVLVALDLDATPLLLLSDLAEHSRNIAVDARVSLLIDGTSGLQDPLTGPRATLLGRAEAVSDKRLLARYLARHPSAAGYAAFADFKLYRMAIDAPISSPGSGASTGLTPMPCAWPATADRWRWSSRKSSGI